MTLPRNHPQRLTLNDEIHARPPEALEAPLRLSFLALTSEAGGHDRQSAEIAALAARFGAAPPLPGANHYSADLGAFRVKWERHTEFSRYTFMAKDLAGDGFEHTAIDLVPADWRAALSGEIIVAAHVAFLPEASAAPDFEALSARHFGGNVLIGGGVGGGAALAVTDFRVHADGFSRFIVEDRSLTPRQAGRMIQRLLEIDTYRMMALLALPVARALGGALTESERELAAIASALAGRGVADEAALLDRLTTLEAEIESRHTDTLFRFGASAAYYALVQRRIAELRETRLPGLQTVEEFLERRLTPAMQTCQAVASRQASLSQRVAHASQLLSTRVEIARQGQSQVLLESMDRRARLQLRLQETVEGLSVAAVTYYVVSLVGHLAEGLEVSGLHLQPKLIEALAIPVVALLAFLGVRRIRRSVARDAE
ncbi:hypothetical protein Sa4125_45620 [Aureimonas sp. SA4125]|uniref:DUF3422 family protein n=1 Tax=Aureimonas sp. SA4125 TaxID=2826993 RepID=UPI001CC3C430|nr:DUF3422 domain-containing protein [Aureimonas sp. SA4125]BDA87020.1 hypothetical protein Sa4125_45620 [Aureimonas sp. SA4125]